MQSGFSASIYDYTSLTSKTGGFDFGNAVTIRDDILKEIYVEAQHSSIIGTLEQFLQTKVTSRGFALEFSIAGEAYPVTSSDINAEMYHFFYFFFP